MKKIIFAVMAVVAAIGLMGGAFAYFSDTETSSSNTFTAGTLDLKLKTSVTEYADYDGNQLFTPVTNMEPGKEVLLETVYLKNFGSITGKVKVDIGYDDIIDPETGEFQVDMSAEDYAKELIITKVYLDSITTGENANKAWQWVSSIVSYYSNDYPTAIAAKAIVAGGDHAYLPTLYGLSQTTLKFYYPLYPTEEDWEKDEEHWQDWYVELNENVNNDFQSDGVGVTIEATIEQYNAP